MTSSIFSTYSTGENRVTSSLLAVLRSLSLSRIERLLGALLEQSEFELVRFQNLPAAGGPGVPDAIILSSCRLLIETKIKTKSVNQEQLRRHLDKLDDTGESTRLLLVLTPDIHRPQVIDEINDDRLVWTPFSALDQAIDELLEDPREVVSEREAFLLRELQTMMGEEKLIGAAKDVVVVPARNAWPEYQRFHAYVCQPRRSFQHTDRLAFYSYGHIHPVVPAILEVHEEVVFEPGCAKGALGALIDDMLRDPKGTHKEAGQRYKVMLLTPPDDSRTLRLDKPIVNDLKSKTGSTTAFTMKQKYVSLDRLKAAKTTSDLV